MRRHGPPRRLDGAHLLYPAAARATSRAPAPEKIQDWPACVVANSHRDCPPDYYTAQKIVGSSTWKDLEWTVCCPGVGGDGAGGDGGPTP